MNLIHFGMIAGLAIGLSTILFSINSAQATTIDFKFLNDGMGSWNPDGMTSSFIFRDNNIGNFAIVVVNVKSDDPTVCGVDWLEPPTGALSGKFGITCTSPPPEGSKIGYVIINQ